MKNIKLALVIALALFTFGIKFAAAQNQTTEVVRGSQSSPTVLADSSGNIYYAKLKLICRFNQKTNREDTLYTHLSRDPWGIAGFTMGNADTVIYYTISDTLCAFNLKTRRKRNVWKGFQYPTALIYRKADSLIY
jgi:hypothetical protein